MKGFAKSISFSKDQWQNNPLASQGPWLEFAFGEVTLIFVTGPYWNWRFCKTINISKDQRQNMKQHYQRQIQVMDLASLDV